MAERTQTYKCQRCGVSVTRRLARGQRPKWCADCRYHGSPSRQRTRPCERCGAPSRTDNNFCSMSCAKQGIPKSRRTIVRMRLTLAAKGSSSNRVRIAGPCRICRNSFVRLRSLDQTCSPQCKATLQLRARRGRHVIRRIEVFERDDYICWLCDESTDPTEPVPHPNAPTVDHVIPRSQGGGHEPENLRCAHFMCNSRRGNKPAAA